MDLGDSGTVTHPAANTGCWGRKGLNWLPLGCWLRWVRLHRNPAGQTDQTGLERIPFLLHPQKVALTSSHHLTLSSLPTRPGAVGNRECLGEDMGKGSARGPGPGWGGPSVTVQIGSNPQGRQPAPRAPSAAYSQATLAFSPWANQGMSGNDYNQPHYPEHCPRTQPGHKTHCSAIL